MVSRFIVGDIAGRRLAIRNCHKHGLGQRRLFLYQVANLRINLGVHPCEGDVPESENANFYRHVITRLILSGHTLASIIQPFAAFERELFFVGPNFGVYRPLPPNLYLT